MSVSLFVGDLGPSTDENSFFHMFQNLGAVKVRLPRDKITQNPLGYGFVDFPTPQEAAYVLQTYNGQPIPGYSGATYRLGAASNGSANSQSGGAGHGSTGSGGSSSSSRFATSAASSESSCTVYIGGLPGEVSESQLISVFRPYGDIKSVNIPKGKGIAFVEMGSHKQAENAIGLLQNAYIGGTLCKVSWGKRPSHSTSQPPTSSSHSTRSPAPGAFDNGNSRTHLYSPAQPSPSHHAQYNPQQPYPDAVGQASRVASLAPANPPLDARPYHSLTSTPPLSDWERHYAAPARFEYGSSPSTSASALPAAGHSSNISTSSIHTSAQPLSYSNRGLSGATQGFHNPPASAPISGLFRSSPGAVPATSAHASPYEPYAAVNASAATHARESHLPSSLPSMHPRDALPPQETWPLHGSLTHAHAPSGASYSGNVQSAGHPGEALSVQSRGVGDRFGEGPSPFTFARDGPSPARSVNHTGPGGYFPDALAVARDRDWPSTSSRDLDRDVILQRPQVQTGSAPDDAGPASLRSSYSARGHDYPIARQAQVQTRGGFDGSGSGSGSGSGGDRSWYERSGPGAHAGPLPLSANLSEGAINSGDPFEHGSAFGYSSRGGSGGGDRAMGRSSGLGGNNHPSAPGSRERSGSGNGTGGSFRRGDGGRDASRAGRDGPAVRVCFAFRDKGRCRDGEACRFSHSREDSREDRFARRSSPRREREADWRGEFGPDNGWDGPRPGSGARAGPPQPRAERLSTRESGRGERERVDEFKAHEQLRGRGALGGVGEADRGMGERFERGSGRGARGRRADKGGRGTRGRGAAAGSGRGRGAAARGTHAHVQGARGDSSSANAENATGGQNKMDPTSIVKDKVKEREGTSKERKSAVKIAKREKALAKMAAFEGSVDVFKANQDLMRKRSADFISGASIHTVGGDTSNFLAKFAKLL